MAVGSGKVQLTLGNSKAKKNSLSRDGDKCSLCSLGAPACSLDASPSPLSAPSKTAMLPFPNENGNLQSQIWGVHSLYIYTHACLPAPVHMRHPSTSPPFEILKSRDLKRRVRSYPKISKTTETKVKWKRIREIEGRYVCIASAMEKC